MLQAFFSALYDEKICFPKGIGPGLIVAAKYSAISSFNKIVPKYPILCTLMYNK